MLVWRSFRRLWSGRKGSLWGIRPLAGLRVHASHRVGLRLRWQRRGRGVDSTLGGLGVEAEGSGEGSEGGPTLTGGGMFVSCAVSEIVAYKLCVLIQMILIWILMTPWSI
jgi:hypothetical protein